MSEARDLIAVIGGYGHVGSQISRSLAAQYPGRILAAGRNYRKAEAFSRTLNGTVMPMEIDIASPPDPKKLERIALVIMCLDQHDTGWTEAILSQGIHYIDISADYRFLSRVEALHPLAEAHGATAVLSVGLAPGFTNLLARQATELLDSTERIDISIMLGLGDTHGRAAIEWTLDNYRLDFQTMEEGRTQQRRSFSHGQRIFFGPKAGTRKAYRFNFADQHIVPRTLQIPRVDTRLCFDSVMVTALFALLKRTGAARLLGVPSIRNRAASAMASVRIGKPAFAVKVDGYGLKDGSAAHAECFFSGTQEAQVTAHAAVQLAGRLVERKQNAGVYHIEQLFPACGLMEQLEGIAEWSWRVKVL